MNRPGPSRECHVCGADFAELYNAATSDGARHAIQLGVMTGVCVSCHRARHAAAVLLMGFADEIRVCGKLGIQVSESILNGARDAERECVRLKMWPASDYWSPADRFRTVRF